MTYPSRERAGPDPAATRGIVVVIVAILIGIVLLWTTGGSGKAKNASTVKSTTTTVARTSPTTAVPQAPATRPAGQVTVIVLNGTDNDEPTAGRDNTDKLQPKGYRTLDPQDVAGQSTAVYFKTGFDADAKAIAAVLGLSANIVQPMPNNAPSAALQADVAVVIGTDHSTGSSSSSSGSTSSSSSSSGSSTGTGGDETTTSSSNGATTSGETTTVDSSGGTTGQ